MEFLRRQVPDNVILSTAVVVLAFSAYASMQLELPTIEWRQSSDRRPLLPGAIGDSPPDDPQGTLDRGYFLVPVYYVTDRARIPKADPDLANAITVLIVGTGILVAVYLLARFAPFPKVRKLQAPITVVAGVLVAAYAGYVAARPVLRGKASYVEYGKERGPLVQGTAWVSIPRDHKVGVIEAPALYKFRILDDPAKDFAIFWSEEAEESRFFHLVKAAVDAAVKDLPREFPNRTGKLLLFIHGFNVSFEDALKRSAQLAYDLKFSGPVVCFSWPSNGAIPLYTWDDRNSAWAATDLAAFLKGLDQNLSGVEVDAVAHSMGNQCLLRGLQAYSLEKSRTDPASKPLFKEAVLAAPDVDSETFVREFSQYQQAAVRFTLYASSKDRALKESVTVNGHTRLGLSGENLVIHPPVQTVDATDVETDFVRHSYFGDSTSVIADLVDVFRGIPPDGRTFLDSDRKNGKQYWRVRRTRSGN